MRTVQSIDLWGGQARAATYNTGVTVDWDDKRLASIDRLRYIGDSGILDFSYCYGTLLDGTKCRVRVPVYQVFTFRQSLKSALLEAARKDGVYLKGLGAFDNLSVND